MKAQTDQALLIRVGRILPVSGAATGPGSLLIEDGRITALGADVKLPAQARLEILDFPSAVAFPGLIDAGCAAGLRTSRREKARPYNPQFRVADGADATDPWFARARNAGVTSAHLIPARSEPIGGVTGVIKVSPEGSRWLREDAALSVSLDDGSYEPNRAPTSNLGLLAHLESEANAADYAALREKKRAAFLTASDTSEIDVALWLGSRYGFDSILFTTADALREKGAALTPKPRGVVVAAFAPDAPAFDRKSLGTLAAAGIPFGFASDGDSRSGSSLRLAAIAAARAGVDTAALHAALTLSPATMLGVADRVGSLEAGKDADVVIFSRDPLDPRAQILAVIQDGAVVYRAPKEDSR